MRHGSFKQPRNRPSDAAHRQAGRIIAAAWMRGSKNQGDKKMLRRLKNTFPLAAAVAMSVCGTPAASAADAATSDTTGAEETQQVIVTGTRQKGVAAAESAAPIQVISGAELAATGK